MGAVHLRLMVAGPIASLGWRLRAVAYDGAKCSFFCALRSVERKVCPNGGHCSNRRTRPGAFLVVAHPWGFKADETIVTGSLKGRRRRLQPRLPFGFHWPLATANLLVPLASRVFSTSTFTLICLGLASAFFARRTFSTPLL